MGKSCMECGNPVPERSVGKRKGGQVAKYCSAVCRTKFGNRRAMRGAELYDYFMSGRYQRATHSGAIAVMTQMAQVWRDKDTRERDARQSWITPDLSADPHALK